MDLQAVLEGREDYLCYPAPDTDRFNLPFNEWLERYIVCQGHEFLVFLKSVTTKILSLYFYLKIYVYEKHSDY